MTTQPDQPTPTPPTDEQRVAANEHAYLLQIMEALEDQRHENEKLRNTAHDLQEQIGEP